ncbi:MAG: hypothetical protein WEF86_00940 [Gemmatimonadota bacterium]
MVRPITVHRSIPMVAVGAVLMVGFAMPSAVQSCDPAFQMYDNCESLTAPQFDDLNEEIREDGNWDDSFNNGSTECVTLYDAWDDAFDEGRVYYSDDPDLEFGEHVGSGDGNGVIIISDNAIDGNPIDGARTAIHEAAHDIGCSGNLAEDWARYCVSDGQTFYPPPSENCSGM